MMKNEADKNAGIERQRERKTFFCCRRFFITRLFCHKAYIKVDGQTVAMRRGKGHHRDMKKFA